MSWVKKILKWLGISILGTIIILYLLKFYADKTYFSNYDPNLPLNPQVEEVKEITDPIEVFGISRPRHFQSIKFSYQSRPGERVPALLVMPIDLKGKVPCVVFLHGIGQSKGFIHEIAGPFVEKGFAMASFDQIMQGERKVKGGPLAQAIAFRQRPWKTINDARRLIDYLQTHPDIDPNRIYLVGASYGAITGCTLTAFEKRIKASILVVGGGNISVMLDAPAITKNTPKWLHRIAKPIIVFMMKVADPIYYAKGTSPTPLLFLNGAEDTLVTPEAGRILFDSAGEPKEIRWYPIEHPGLRDKDGPEIIRMLDEGLEWLVEQDNRIKRELYGYIIERWYRGWDSNPGHLEPQSSALTN